LTLQLVDVSIQGDHSPPFDEIIDNQNSAVAIKIGVRGPRPVDTVLWFPQSLAEILVQALVQHPLDWPLTGMAQSALLELANIGFTSFINIIADVLHASWTVTAPRMLSLDQKRHWQQNIAEQEGSMTLITTWRVNETTYPPLIMVWSPSNGTLHRESDTSPLTQWIPADQWNQLLDANAWYPVAMRWARTWSDRFTEAHWAQIVVQTMPFPVASLWEVRPDGTAALLASKSYRLTPGERVSIREPHQNLIAAAYHWRRSVSYPHSQIFSLMRYLTNATRVLAIPLTLPDGVIGVLTVGEVQERNWSDGLASVIENFAPLLAQALEQHIRLHELERHAALFRWMNGVVESVWDPTAGNRDHEEQIGPPSAILRAWRKQWPRLAGIGGGLWIFWDEARKRWCIHDAWGPWTFRTPELHKVWWPAIRQWLQAEPDDCRRRGWREPPHPAALGNQRVYWYPIWESDHLIGAGILWIPESPGRDDRVLESLLDVVGMAVIAIRRQRQLLVQSQQDPLTDTLNRRGLEQAVANMLQTPAISSAVFCLVDLDRFKPVNDVFGHAVGDQLLVDWSHFVRTSLRSGDWIGRIGGDEFVWVLTQSSWSDAVKDRLRHLIENSPLSVYGASATLGVVEIPREASSYREAYRLADERLYVGKQQGRSRIVGPDGVIVILNG
jgi:diguanylate cyclase (GGDEF)-like protein